MEHPQELIDRVRQEMATGLSSPDIIAIRVSASVEAVEEIVRSLGREKKEVRSNVDIMRDNLALLQDLLDTAEWEYKGEPTIDNASALVQMIQTSLSTIKEIEARKDPAVIMNEILGRLLQPLFRDIIKYATAEAAKARDDLYESVPREHHLKIDTAFKGVVNGMGRSTSVDYKRMVNVLASILECKPEDEKVRPLLRAVSSDEDHHEQEAQSPTDSQTPTSGGAA